VSTSSPTGVAVKAKRLFINFILVLFKPVVEIDGQPLDGSWSSTMFFPTAPGPHSVSVYWKYFWLIPCNRASATVGVIEGGVTELTYQARWFVFLPGKVVVSQAAAVPVAA
jgi:hypothetical protein